LALQALAKDVLRVLATPVPCEGLFSPGDYFVNKRHSALDPETDGRTDNMMMPIADHTM